MQNNFAKVAKKTSSNKKVVQNVNYQKKGSETLIFKNDLQLKPQEIYHEDKSGVCFVYFSASIGLLSLIVSVQLLQLDHVEIRAGF